MIRRTVLLLLVAGSIAGLTAGCGGSSNNNSSTPSASTGTGTSGASTSGGGASSNPAVQAAVAQCKQRINAASKVSSSLKAKLVKLCDAAASGNPAQAKKVGVQVCKEIVASELPSVTPSAIKNKALAQCNNA